MPSLTKVAQLVEECGGKIYEFTLAICGNPGEAEEILQQSFAAAISDLPIGQEEGSLCRPLLEAVATGVVRRLRKRDPESFAAPMGPEASVGELAPVEIAPWGDNPERSYPQAELRRLVNDALQTLAPLPRLVVILHDREKFSLEEITCLLDLSLAATKSCLLQGRLKLRNQLDRHFRRPSCESGP